MIRTLARRAMPLVVILAFYWLIFPFPMNAASTLPNFTAPVTSLRTNTGEGSVWSVFCSVVGWWLFFTFGLSIIFGVWAGWTFILDSGKGMSEKARNMLQYALIGVAIGMIALGLPLIAADFLHFEGVQACTFGATAPAPDQSH